MEVDISLCNQRSYSAKTILSYAAFLRVCSVSPAASNTLYGDTLSA